MTALYVLSMLLLTSVAYAQGGGTTKGIQTDADLKVGKNGVKPVACATAGVLEAAAVTLFDQIPTTIGPPPAADSQSPVEAPDAAIKRHRCFGD